MKPEHVISFLTHIIAVKTAKYAEIKSQHAKLKAEHEKTIWFRWFRMKWDLSHWDESWMNLSCNRAVYEKAAELLKKAEYCQKMCYDTCMLENIPYCYRFADNFYLWAAENGIPYWDEFDVMRHTV